MTQAQHLLVVDDEQRVRDMLRRYLEQEGFRVTAVPDGAAMRAALEADRVDLVLLDLVLPTVDGLELAREIRASSAIPIIMLTGRGEMVDRVVGLEVGADDYIAKPFHLREVLARIRSVLRRAEAASAARTREASQDEDRGAFRFAGWRLDPGDRTLADPEGRPVDLTQGEFDLLRVFLERPRRTLTRDSIMTLWKGRRYEAFDRAIDAQVSRLRRKIERDPAAPELVKSVRGVGYYFAASVTRDKAT